jgi:RHS repeat-associated protein
VFEEGTFKPAAKLTDDKKYSIITDYLGTPAQMYDEKGKLTWDMDLDIYGKARTFVGRSLSECPFRYQGQYEDSETGLYYNRFRYYSPDEGIYLSKDPIGLAGNNPTLYGYVKDVNSRFDVFALAPIKPFDITTYQDFSTRSVAFDSLEGHELLQHSWLKEHNLAQVRLENNASKQNIVIALDSDLHKQVNKAQRSIDVKTQTAIQNIDANAKILKEAGVDPEVVDAAAKKAKTHAISIGCK